MLFFFKCNIFSECLQLIWTETPQPPTQLADDHSLKLFEVTHITVSFQFYFFFPWNEIFWFRLCPHCQPCWLRCVWLYLFSHVQKYKVVRQRSTLRSIPLGKPWSIINNCNTESEELNGFKWVMGLVIISHCWDFCTLQCATQLVSQVV